MPFALEICSKSTLTGALLASNVLHSALSQAIELEASELQIASRDYDTLMHTGHRNGALVVGEGQPATVPQGGAACLRVCVPRCFDCFIRREPLH